MRVVQVFETLLLDVSSVEEDEDDDCASKRDAVLWSVLNSHVFNPALINLPSTKSDGDSLRVTRLGRLLAGRGIVIRRTRVCGISRGQ